MTRMHVYLSVVALLFVPFSLHAENTLNLDKVINTQGELSVSFVKTIAHGIEGSPPAITEHAPQINVLLDKIQQKENSLQSELLGIDLARKTIDGAVAIVTVASSVVPPVAILGNMVYQKTMDAVQTHVGNEAKAKTTQFILAQREAITKATGFSVEQLKELSEEELKSNLKKVDVLYKHLDGQTEDSRKLKEELIYEQFNSLGVAALSVGTLNSEEIAQAKSAFNEFSNKTSIAINSMKENVQVAEKYIERVDTKVNALAQEMDKVQDRLGQHEKDIALLSDFMFSRSSSREKIASLNGGLFSSRFACKPKDLKKECDKRAETKKSLISYYEKQVELEDTLSDISEFSNKIGNIATIASNLGIASPELQKASQLANIANNVVQSMVSAPPNYLGAAVAVSSLFSKPSDPAADRHAQIMNYLKEQFEQINVKLDRIIENQQKTMGMISNLSKQSLKQFQILDKKLNFLTYQQRSTLNALGDLSWDKWESCHSVYVLVSGQQSMKYGFDKANYQFNDIKGAFEAKNDRANSLSICLENSISSIDSIYKPDSFGSFITLAPSNLKPEQELTIFSVLGYIPREDELGESLLSQFESDIVEPTEYILNYGIKHENHWSSIYVTNRLPYKHFLPADKLIVDAPCHKPQGLSIVNTNWLPILCRNGSDAAEDRAEKYLRVPVNGRHPIDVAKWMLVVTRLGEFQNAGNFFYKNLDDLYTEINKGTVGAVNISQMLSYLESTEAMLSLSISNISHYYSQHLIDNIIKILSDEYAPFISVEDLEKKESNFKKQHHEISESRKRIDKLLAHNSYLRSNVITRILSNQFSNISQKAFISSDVYDVAINLVHSDENHTLLPIEALFEGFPGMTFSFDETIGNINVCLAVTQLREKKTAPKRCTPLPSSREITTGEIAYPTVIYELIKIRNIVRDRIIDIRVVEDLTLEERRLMYSILK